MGCDELKTSGFEGAQIDKNDLRLRVAQFSEYTETVELYTLERWGKL